MGSRREVSYRPLGDPFQEPQPCFHASRAYYRFLVLFFNCMLTFGSYFCFDMPSALKKDFITGQKNCTIGHANCTEGLGLSETNYNLLFTVYAWTNAGVVIASGFLLDKLGNRVGVVLFSALCLVGGSIFALGLLFKSHKDTMFTLFLLGRLMFGAGNGSLTIVQNRISAFWFEGKELAFAFGCTLAFSRLGSVLNFLLTESFNEKFGMKWTLWGGAILCAVSFAAGLVVCVLDKVGISQMGRSDDLRKQSRRMRISDIRYFRLQYWLLVFTTMFFYNMVFPFISNASEFVRDTYHYEERHSDYIVGAVYDVSMVISPGMGIIVDSFGMRGILSLLCTVATIPVFGIFTFATQVPPLVGTIWLGVTYSVAAASLWPSVPLVIDHSTLGTALGIMTSIQMIGIGLCGIVLGEILDHTSKANKWKFVMLFMLANSFACLLLSALLNFVDWKRGGILNRTKKKRSVHKKLSTPTHSPREHGPYTETESLLYPEQQERSHEDSIN